MELFGILFAVPVTFATSFVYAALIVWASHRWPAARFGLLVFSGWIGACITAEAAALSVWGAKGAYAQFGLVFTLVHFVNFFLAPPAVAHTVLYLSARVTTRAWLQLTLIVPFCWLACMVAIIGNIVIDESIVGPDGPKPFYMTDAEWPNQPAPGHAGFAPRLAIERHSPGAPGPGRSTI